MRLRNTTNIPNGIVQEIIRFVRPSGIANFDVMLRNAKNTRHCSGRAYTQGSGYHDRASAFIVAKVPGDTYPVWRITDDNGKHWTIYRRWSGDKNCERINRPTYPVILNPYQRGQLRGKRYVIANRIEHLVYIMAHELRHLWQAKASGKPRGMAHGARGRFSEIDTESYAIRMVRAWRKNGTLPEPVTLTPKQHDIADKTKRAARRAAERAAKTAKLLAAQKRWTTKAKRAATALKKITRQLKRLDKKQAECAQ